MNLRLTPTLFMYNVILLQKQKWFYIKLRVSEKIVLNLISIFWRSKNGFKYHI